MKKLCNTELFMKQRILVVVASVGVAVASAGSLNAQAAPGSEKVAFEAASIKPAPPDETRRGARRQPGGRIEIYNMTLRMLIRVAHESETLQTAEQFVGGPGWAETDRFNIVAKAEGEFDSS